MMTFNFVLSVFCVWLIVILNTNYLQPALKNRRRFKLYRLRDRLSLLAMRGDIPEDSEEYITLLRLVNHAIRATGSFKVTDYFRFLLVVHQDDQLRKSISRIHDRIRSSLKSDHLEYCQIAEELFLTMRGVLRSETRILRRILIPVLEVLLATANKMRLLNRATRKVRSKEELIDQLDAELGNYSSEFRTVCPI
ncbi:MAG: hypothetical protein K9L70_02580 [Thiohalocapsa sp.]|nr:hypothetical protein [Thiohalocapsa sp.]MCF7990064.1 hypothetical protein [Thiohalocapsa sp.]